MSNRRQRVEKLDRGHRKKGEPSQAELLLPGLRVDARLCEFDTELWTQEEALAAVHKLRPETKLALILPHNKRAPLSR